MKAHLDHGLEHLRGCDDGLALVVALLDHHLLCQEDLLCGNLHAQITTGNLLERVK